MIRNTPLTLRLSVASLSLLLAIAVYLFARIYPPDLLKSLQILNGDLAAYTGFFGSAPSLFYTLALGLLIGACASSRLSAMVHCFIWIGLALLLELSQAPIVAKPLIEWLAGFLSASGWELVGPYWIRGTFDWLDMLASVIGGFIAIAILINKTGEQGDENI